MGKNIQELSKYFLKGFSFLAYKIATALVLFHSRFLGISQPIFCAFTGETQDLISIIDITDFANNFGCSNFEWEAKFDKINCSSTMISFKAIRPSSSFFIPAK